MLISRNWLQTHFNKELPAGNEIANLLMTHSFEIEEVIETENDVVIDVDVLPNRAHDCLSYDGFAKELSAILNTPLKENRFKDHSEFISTENFIDVKNTSPEQCFRYEARLVKNIKVTDSPKWLSEALGSMGQKSINALVDATNYLMFDLGQPMHVFDADKISGSIHVRNAHEGEVMTILGGEEITLLESDLVIADDDSVLALAGVKGGVKAELGLDTKNIVIESANFNSLTTRQTARRVKISSDASKRYENGISSVKSILAMEQMLALVLDLSATEQTEVSLKNDRSVSYPSVEEGVTVNLELSDASKLLGLDLDQDAVDGIFDSLNFAYSYDSGTYSVDIPAERLDLRVSADLIEEIGRMYGYHKIPSKSLEELDFTPLVNNNFLSIQLLKNYFVEAGFYELMNYSLVKKGGIELRNPLNSDKKSMRKNLDKQLLESMEKNTKISDYMGLDQICNFEIDAVHDSEGKESWLCSFGVDTLSKKSRKKYGSSEDQLIAHVEKIKDLFNLDILDFEQDKGVISFNIDQLSANISDSDYGDLFDKKSFGSNAEFKNISQYPYMKRDVSFWVSDLDLNADSLMEKISSAGANFLQKIYLFDEFEKEGKRSFAFSLIFQSNERTLVDVDVDANMNLINSCIELLGGDIR